MIKYGVEHITQDQDRITMYNSKAKAEEAAEKLSKEIKSGESVALFYAECDDQGRLATNEFNMLRVWG